MTVTLIDLHKGHSCKFKGRVFCERFVKQMLKNPKMIKQSYTGKDFEIKEDLMLK